MGMTSHDQRDESGDGLNGATITRKPSDRLKLQLEPAVEELTASIAEGEAFIVGRTSEWLQRDEVARALRLSIRQMSQLSSIFEAINVAGTPSHDRDQGAAVAILPAVAMLLQRRPRETLDEGERALVLAYETSRMEVDALVQRWYEPLAHLISVSTKTGALPEAITYLRQTEAGDRAEDLFQEIQVAETQRRDADPPKDSQYELEIEQKTAQLEALFREAPIRPEGVREVLECLELHVCHKSNLIPPFCAVVEGLHKHIGGFLTKRTDDLPARIQLPFFDQQGKLTGVSVRGGDLQELLSSDEFGEIFTQFVAARKCLSDAVQAMKHFEQTRSQLEFQGKIKRVLVPVTGMAEAAIALTKEENGQRLSERVVFDFLTQASFDHQGGENFNETAAFVDLNEAVVKGAIASQAFIFRSLFSAPADEAKRMLSTISRAKMSEDFKENALPLVGLLRTLIAEGRGRKAAALVDEILANGTNSRDKKIVLVTALAAIAQDARLRVSLKNRLPHLTTIPDFVSGIGALSIKSALEPCARDIVRGLGVNLDDYIGQPKLVSDVRVVLDEFFVFNQHPEVLQGITPDLAIYNGLLLHGGYGLGKSYLLRCIETDYGFRRFDLSWKLMIEEKRKSNKDLSLSPDEIIGYAEVVLENVRNAAKNGPVFLTIDELHGFAADRRRFPTRQAVTDYMLVAIEDLRKGYSNVFIAATTNLYDEIDPAMKRKGRFDVRIKMDLMPLEALGEVIDVICFQETDRHLPESERLELARFAIGMTVFSPKQAIINHIRYRQARGDEMAPTVEELMKALERAKAYEGDEADSSVEVPVQD